jgi:hypothetical protein
MTNLTAIQTSLDAEQGAARARRRPSIAARIGSMGQNRISALLLLVATLAVIVRADVSLASCETFWGIHLMVGVGDLRLDFTLHALVNDALMAIFFFTVGLEVRREFAIGEYARAAANSLRESISINERLRSAYAPYVA